MRLVKILVAASLVVLVGCEKTGDKDSPAISRIYTTITQAHPSYEDKVLAGSVNTENKLFASLEFRVSDDDGVDDINTLTVNDGNNGRQELLLERFPGDSMGSGYTDFIRVDGISVLIDLFNFDLSYDEIEERVELDNWSLSVNDLQGYSSSRSFEFALFDGDRAFDEEFVYADSSAVTLDGVQAMEVIEAADISVASSELTRTLSVSFDVTDARAKNYEIWIYDDDDLEITPELIVPADSPSIASTPIVVGGTTNLVLPWDEIPSEDLFDAASLDGIHVVLLDEGEESSLVLNRQVYSQRSISEYVSFTVVRL